MTCLPRNPASRRYLSRFFIAMSLYILFIFFAKWGFRHLHPTGAAVYALALLPALPILATIIIVGMYLVEEQDEFQRNILIQSMLWGIGLTMAFLTVWGFLEIFAEIPHFQPYLAYSLFWAMVGVTSPLLKRRYR